MVREKVAQAAEDSSGGGTTGRPTSFVTYPAVGSSVVVPSNGRGPVRLTGRVGPRRGAGVSAGPFPRRRVRREGARRECRGRFWKKPRDVLTPEEITGPSQPEILVNRDKTAKPVNRDAPTWETHAQPALVREDHPGQDRNSSRCDRA